jgi:glycosyltransferase involved in cell wall biosynthesis
MSVSSGECPGCSIVIPAFNEEEGLLTTLEGVRGVLRGAAGTFEIVVVDDGSTDATPRILAGCPDVSVVRHAQNRGYGAALKAGIRAARHPLIVVMDADGTYPVDAIPGLVEGCLTADMVVGARIGRNVQSAPLRNAVKWCFRQFAQWITGARIPDLNSGLRVFDRRVAERFITVLPDGFSFTTTITVASLLEGLTVRFAGVDYMPRIGRSKVRPVRDTVRIARQLARLGLSRAPFRTWMALALPCMAVGLIASLAHLVGVGRVLPRDLAWLGVGGLLAGAGLAAELRVRRRRYRAAEVVDPRESVGR